MSPTTMTTLDNFEGKGDNFFRWTYVDSLGHIVYAYALHAPLGTILCNSSTSHRIATKRLNWTKLAA